MAITVAQNSGALWLQNHALTDTLTASVTGSVAIESNYPLANLQDPRRSTQARWTWDAAGSLNLYFYSTTKRVVTGLALVDCNLHDKTSTPTPPLTLYASDGSAGSTPAADYYAWHLYTYASETGVMRWYPNLTHGSASVTNGTPFSSDLAANGANLYTVRFAGDYGTFPTLRLGAVVLSTVEAINIASGASVEMADPSTYAQAYDGTTYVDILPAWRSVGFAVPPMAQADWYALSKQIRAHGPRQQVLDVHGYAASTDGGATTTEVDRAGAVYGRFAPGSLASVTLGSTTNTVASFRFDESRGGG